jgi:CheY-like chemotaxis protein
MKTQNTCGLHQARIFTVDDNEHMRILLRTLLNAMGARALHEFADASVALSSLEAFRPDMILTDLSMAPMDGLAFTQAVRRSADPHICVVPILMITAHTERGRIESARDSGVNEILAKPVTAAGLHRRIEQIVYRPRVFVRSPNYVGPCRRRRDNPDHPGPWRRAGDPGQEGAGNRVELTDDPVAAT